MGNPIFVIGCPRSGTTIALKIMAMHEQLSWVSKYLNRFPLKTGYTILNRLYDLPCIGKRLYFMATQDSSILPRKLTRFLPAPVEPWTFWTEYLSSFRWDKGKQAIHRRRTAQDISDEEVCRIREVIDSIVRTQNKTRFLSKYTDYPRIKYLTQAFPDAQFVHVLRDGRAVAASYHKIMEDRWLNSWKNREWWINSWPEEWKKEWIDRTNSKLNFGAYQWKYLVSEIKDDAKVLPSDQYIEIRYSDMVNSPYDTFKRVFHHCNLKDSRKVNWYLNKANMRNMNTKWKTRYTAIEKDELDRIIHEPELRTLLIE